MRKLTFLLTAVTGILSAWCCSELFSTTEPEPELQLQSIDISRSDATISVGEEIQLEVFFTPDELHPAVQWESLNPTIAAVSGSGKVTGISKGVATIKASASGKSTSCKVTVKDNTIEVGRVIVEPYHLNLPVGRTEKLTATVQPADATDKTVTWSSSDPSTASVDQNGVVTAIEHGNVTITATAGGEHGTCSISVYNPITSITLEPTEATMYTSDQLQLNATRNPVNTVGESIKWSSSDENIATVSDKGLVRALSGGHVTITAMVNEWTDGKEVTATCSITVMQDVYRLDLDKTSLSLNKGETYKLTATLTPDTFLTTDKINWSSSNTAVATVDGNGLVTCTGAGQAVITAECNGARDECTVTGRVAPTAIALSLTELTVRTNESVQLELIVSPADADRGQVQWKSSDATVAKVDANGLVTGLKGGKATITAKDPSLPEVSCQVTVLQSVQSVTLDKTTLAMSRGATYRLTATVSPAQYADYDRVEWSSSNDGVAVVDQTGLVTCTGSGTAVISAVAGGKSASCTVTGHVYVESVTLDETNLSLGVGEVQQLVATILPYDATVQTATWSSSNTSIVTVDKNGNVKGVKVGTATVTATADGQKATCEVTVTNKVTSLTLNVITLKLRQGESYQFTATVKPTNATNKEVSWSVSSTSIATIDDSGLLTTKKEGTVTVTASVQDGLTAECEVTVSNQTGGGGHEGTGEETWY